MPDPEVPGNGPNGRVVVAGGPAPFGIPATFGVSENTGVMTYSVPIDVPPGVAKMQPDIALQYNSGSGNGEVGVGWSISGLSEIVRCPQTIAVANDGTAAGAADDTIAGGVNDDGNDRFCLDGQQLLAVPAQGQSTAGAYGGNGTNYAKEIDDLSEIVSYGGNNVSPSYFIVHTKSGLTLEYGNTATSQYSQLVANTGSGVVETWALDKVTDPQSNFMTINYINYDWVLYPYQIYYTGNSTAGTSTTSSVIFGWQSRTDDPVLYAAGSQHQTVQRLQSIRTYAQYPAGTYNTLVSDYELAYSYGCTTQRSDLVSITKYDGSSPQNALPPLTFSYSDSNAACTAAAVDVQPDLITSISNGFGATTNIKYLPATSPSVDAIGYSSSGEGAEISSTAPSTSVVYQVRQVVPVTTYTSPTSPVQLGNVNDTYEIQYYFASPEIDLWGRGYLGLVDANATDLQTGLDYVEIFDHGFPYVDDPYWVLEQTSSGTWVDCYENIYPTKALDPSEYLLSAQGTAFPYLYESIETRNEVAPGASYSQPVATSPATLPTITRTFSYDSSASNGGTWGNLVQEVDTTSDGYSSTTTTGYVPATGTYLTDWFTGLVASSSVATQGIGQSTAQTRTVNYTYNTPGYPSEISSVVVESGQANNLQSTSDYTYDDYGNVLEEETENSDLAGAYPWTSVTYDSIGQFPVTVTFAVSGTQTETETLAHDARFGGVTSLKDVNNQTTTFSYDTFGRLTKKTNPDLSYTSTQYDYSLSSGIQQMYIEQQSYASGGSPQIDPETVFNYDAIGRDVFDQMQVFNGSLSTITHIYDGNGNLWETSKLYPLGTTTATLTKNTYDELGRVILTVNPDNSQDTTSYLGTTNNSGEQITSTNGLGQKAIIFKDGHGNVSWSEDSLGDTMNFVYDGFDQRTKVTDSAGNVTTYAFDILGRGTSGTDPDKGAWTAGYNSLGELTSTTDAVGNTSGSYIYDLLGRMRQRTETGVSSAYPSLTSKWVYDTAANGVGELASETASGTASPSGSTAIGYTKTFSYDSFGRLSQTVVTEPLPWQSGTNGTFTQAYTYDSASRPTTITTGWGDGFTTSYNPTGYRYLVQQTSPSTNVWQQTSSDAANSITGATYGSSINQSFTYDPNTERMLTVSATGPNPATLQSLTYTYDVLGNVLTRTNNTPIISVSPFQESSAFEEFYSYDGLNRLCSVNPGTSNLATLVGPTQTCPSQPTALTNVGIGVTYDALGDITSKLGDGGVGTYTYPSAGAARPHAFTKITTSSVDTNASLQSNFTPSYDSDGNLIFDERAQGLRFSASGMPSQVCNITCSFGSPLTEFFYGPDNERVSQVQSGTGAIDTLYLTDMNVTAAPSTTTGSVYSYFDDNNGQVVGEIYRSGVTNLSSNTAGSTGTATTEFFLNDWQNSVSIITNSSGAVLEADSYDPWGKRRNLNGSPDVNDAITSMTIHGYTNQEELTNVQLVDLNARLYDPYVGSLLSVDPAVANWLDPQTWNAYAYARDNPMVYKDPTGMTDELTLPEAKVIASGGSVDVGDDTISGSGGGVIVTNSDGDEVPSATFGVAGGASITITANAGGGSSITGSAGGGGFQAVSDTTSGAGSSGSVTLNQGQQDKHIPGTNNYDPNRSTLTDPNPQSLLDSHAGTGQAVNNVPPGRAGYKERVNFGKIIGNWVDKLTGERFPTTNGIIHYGNNGAHIVPARPTIEPDLPVPTIEPGPPMLPFMYLTPSEQRELGIGGNTT